MTVFLVLGFVGLGLVALSLLVGDHLEAVFGGALNALEGDVFSTAVIGGFVSAFGFGAAAADGAGLPAIPVLAIGGVSGFVVGWFAWWLTRLIKDGPSDGTVSLSDTVGQVGRVLTAIPGGQSYGVVRITRRRPRAAVQRDLAARHRRRRRSDHHRRPVTHRGHRGPGLEA